MVILPSELKVSIIGSSKREIFSARIRSLLVCWKVMFSVMFVCSQKDLYTTTTNAMDQSQDLSPMT